MTCTGEFTAQTTTHTAKGTETINWHGAECNGHPVETATSDDDTVSMRFGRNGSAIHTAYRNGNVPMCGAYFRPGTGVVVSQPATCKRCTA